MAVDGRIRVRHEDVFPEPVLVLSVEPVEDYDKRKAGEVDTQDRDRDTGQRVWAVSILDPTARPGNREIKVKVPADVQPVPPAGVMGPVVFADLVITPWVDDSRARPRLGIAYRASGLLPATTPAPTSTAGSTGSIGASGSTSSGRAEGKAGGTGASSRSAA
jgi:hypothetical protein